MDIWCYDALDFQHTDKEIHREKIYINLSERLMLIEFVNRNILEACKYRPSIQDKVNKFKTTRALKINNIKQHHSIIEIEEDADEDGFVTL